MRIPVPPGWGPPAASSRIPVAPASRNARAVPDHLVRDGARGHAQGLGDGAADGGDGRRRLVAVELDLVGIHGGDDPGQLRGRQVGGDHDDPRPGPIPGGRRAGQAGQLHALLDREGSRGPGCEVEPDGVHPGPGRGQDPRRVGDAADLDPRRTGITRGVHAGTGRRPRRHGRRQRGRRLASAPRPRAPRRTRSRASGRWSRCRAPRTRRRPARSPGIPSRRRTARSGSTSRVRRSRLLMPMSRAPVARARSSSRASCASTSGSRPRSRASRHEPGQAPRRVQHRQQEHEVGAGSPEEVELPRIDDELLGQDGHGDGRAHGAQVPHGPAEPVGLAQDGDGGRAAGGVGTGARDRVVRRRRWHPADGELRLTSAMRWRPGAARASAIGRGAGAAATARLSPSGPRASSSGTTSARRRAAISATTPAVMPGPRSCASRCRVGRRRLPSAARRSARSLPSSSTARPASTARAARSTPSSMLADLARRHERGPGVEQHDVPPRPGLAAQHALDQRRVRGRIGAAQRRRLRLAQPHGLGVHLASLDALPGSRRR